MNNRKRIVAVNATALANGGGLSILQQFVDHIVDEHQYYIFVPHTLTIRSLSDAIHIIPVSTNSFVKRVLWDLFGLKRWFAKQDLMVDVVLSLQNTSVSYHKHIKQWIYVHQGLCLHPAKWSFLKRQERMLAMYKYIYPFFIFLHANRHTEFIVQTQWMKDRLCDQFKRSTQQVHVIKPDVLRVDIADVDTIVLPESNILFYPANHWLFKNHDELFFALHEMRNSHYDMSSIGLYLTMDEDPRLVRLLEKLGLRQNVHFVGTLSYDEVLVYYKSCSAVVFPSYIESFGLPLLEAAMFGKPIIAADESYAREVLAGYTNVRFVALHSPLLWRDAIVQSLECASVREGYVPRYDSSWDDVFQLLHS